jgi:DNA-binding NarL/FixJ family response regulator
VNEKTLALGDYAVTVNEEIEKNHNEVMFLYNMLSDKQKEIMTTATMVDEYRKDVEAFVENNHISVQRNDETEIEEAIKEIDEDINESQEPEDNESSNEIILELHKSGLSILEIAKQLGLGVGEVKLVVDLYQGANE